MKKAPQSNRSKVPVGVPAKARSLPGPIAWLLAPHRMFVCLAISFGSAFILITPPFQVPDEGAHFCRAFELAEGQVWQRMIEGKRGTEIPVSLDTLGAAFNYLRFRSAQRVVPGQVRELMKVPFEPDKREVIQNAAAGYGYLNYIPQVPAVLAGRLLGMKVLPVFYWGRFMALLFYIICVGYALSRIPGARYVLMTVALMPMALFQAGSFSPDCVTFSLAFLGVSLVLERMNSEKPWRWDPEGILLLIILAVMGVLKPVYLPLSAIILALPNGIFRTRLTGWAVKVGVLLSAAALAWLWHRLNAAAGGFQAATDVNGMPIDPAGKLAALLQAPTQLVTLYRETLGYFGQFYIRSTIGVLGFLDTRLPDWLYPAFITFILAVALFSQGGKLRILPLQRLMLAIVGIGVVSGTILAMYLFTRIKSNFIAEGVQGRYFIPAIFPLLLAMHRWIPLKFLRKGKTYWLVTFYGLLFLFLLFTARTLYLRYYGPA